MHISTRVPVVVWIFGKTISPPIGKYINGDVDIEVPEGIFSVVFFKIVNNTLESSGQVYVNKNSSFPIATINPTLITSRHSNWNCANTIVIKDIELRCHIKSLNKEYASIHREACDRARKYIVSNFKSNAELISLTGHKQLGFCRLSQRRDGHHGIMTTSVAGIPELHSNNIGVHCFEMCCNLVMGLMGFDAIKFGSADKSSRKISLEELSCGVLAACGFKYRWNDEPYDSICLPSVVLGTMQDCEDNAVSVIASFNWIIKNVALLRHHLKGVHVQIINHIVRMCKRMYLAAGFVDVKIANPTITNPNTLSGHAFAVLELNDDYVFDKRFIIIEGTDSFYVHKSTYDKHNDELFVQTSTCGILQQVNTQANGSINNPSLQPTARYKTVNNLFTENNVYFVCPKNHRSVVGVKTDDFLSGMFDLVPIVPDYISKSVISITKDFVLSPSLEQAGVLMDSIPELNIYKDFDEKNITSYDIDNGTPYTAYFAYDINKNKKPQKGVLLSFPLCNIILVPCKIGVTHFSR